MAAAVLMTTIWVLLPSGLIQRANADAGAALLSDRPLEAIYPNNLSVTNNPYNSSGQLVNHNGLGSVLKSERC
jgi:hypothetical protein